MERKELMKHRLGKYKCQTCGKNPAVALLATKYICKGCRDELPGYIKVR